MAISSSGFSAGGQKSGLNRAYPPTLLEFSLVLTNMTSTVQFILRIAEVIRRDFLY